MTNADRIRNMTDAELARFIRKIYLHGKNEEGFEFCGYNLEAWVSKNEVTKGQNSRTDLMTESKDCH